MKNLSILLQYFPEFKQEQLEKLEKFSELLLEWNSKINLISRKDIDNLFEHNILHSLAIAKFFNFKKTTKIIDLGTGGGLPGIPLAIVFPDVHFDLVDSITKKIIAVKDMCEKLNLKNVNTLNVRAETLKPNYDFVVSRAVTNFENFYKLSKNLFRKKDNNQLQGIIYLKGGDFKQELQNFNNYVIYSISDCYEEEFFFTKKIIFLQK